MFELAGAVVEVVDVEAAGWLFPNKEPPPVCVVPPNRFEEAGAEGGVSEELWLVPPNMLDAGCWGLFAPNKFDPKVLEGPPAGGCPAGVVDGFPNENVGPLAAGVDVAAGVEVAGVLPRLPNKPPPVLAPPPNKPVP
jgi:hypothetical protein